MLWTLGIPVAAGHDGLWESRMRGGKTVPADETVHAGPGTGASRPQNLAPSVTRWLPMGADFSTQGESSPTRPPGLPVGRESTSLLCPGDNACGPRWDRGMSEQVSESAVRGPQCGFFRSLTGLWSVQPPSSVANLEVTGRHRRSVSV